MPLCHRVDINNIYFVTNKFLS